MTLDVKQTNYSKSCENVIRNTHSCKAKIKGISPRRRFARKMGRQMVPSLGSFDSSFVLQQVDKSPEKIRHGAPNSSWWTQFILIAASFWLRNFSTIMLCLNIKSRSVEMIWTIICHGQIKINKYSKWVMLTTFDSHKTSWIRNLNYAVLGTNFVHSDVLEDPDHLK